MKIKKFNEYFNNFNDYSIDDIKVGYYVKANYGKAMDKNVIDFLDENFGVIIHIDKNKNYFLVRYNNVPEDIKNYFMESGYLTLKFTIKGLIEYAPTEEELELKLSSNKYNL